MTTETSREAFGTVLPALLDAYQQWKSYEKAKNAAKDAFFSLADQVVEDRGLAMKVIDMSAPSEELAMERVRRHYPGWVIDEARPHRWKEGVIEVLVMEDPALQPFSIEHEGWKFARTIRKGAVMLDEEWLASEDPELYAQVTYKLPWGAVIALPIDQLSKEVLPRLQKYIYNDVPRSSLAAPREAKEE